MGRGVSNSPRVWNCPVEAETDTITLRKGTVIRSITFVGGINFFEDFDFSGVGDAAQALGRGQDVAFGFGATLVNGQGGFLPTTFRLLLPCPFTVAGTIAANVADVIFGPINCKLPFNWRVPESADGQRFKITPAAGAFIGTGSLWVTFEVDELGQGDKV